MDQKYFEEIKAREQAATPGPWKPGDGSEKAFMVGKNAVVASLRVIADRAVYPDDYGFNEQTYADIAFIAHARADIPALIEQHELDQQQIAALKESQKALESDRINDEMNLENLTAEIEGLNIEKATLKRALRLESEHVAKIELFPNYGTKVKENAQYISEDFIQQAQGQKKSDDYVDGMCCDCVHDKRGFCGDYSENRQCKFKHEDGSCWTKPTKRLIAELKKENQGLRANSAIQESIIHQGYDPADKDKIVRLIMDNTSKKQQIAKLERALELAVPNDNDRECYLQQAQEEKA